MRYLAEAIGLLEMLHNSRQRRAPPFCAEAVGGWVGGWVGVGVGVGVGVWVCGCGCGVSVSHNAT
jgi:hypothetical protein